MNCVATPLSYMEPKIASVDIHGSKHFFAPDFTPGGNDVLMGRGKKCFEHAGNKRLRDLVASKLNEYSAATTKKDKTNILLSIVSQVRLNSPRGGFIKLDQDAGLWFEVGDFLAREKVSQAFRDALHSEYRSSNEFKKKRKREQSSKGNSSKHSSKRFKSQLEPSIEKTEPRQSNDDCLSNGLNFFSLESSIDLFGSSMKAPLCTSSSSSATSCFEYGSNPFEPIPISDFSKLDVGLFGPFPGPEDFDKLFEELDANNDCSSIFKPKFDETNCQSVSCKGWSGQQQRSISKPTLNSLAARTA